MIGIHGNTLIHNPKGGKSIQLGNAEFISKTLNIPVIDNFRKRYFIRWRGSTLVPLTKDFFQKKKYYCC